ncbi:MAG: hemerythrin-like domain-containing protein [Bradymonadia bacterium]
MTSSDGPPPQMHALNEDHAALDAALANMCANLDRLEFLDDFDQLDELVRLVDREIGTHFRAGEQLVERVLGIGSPVLARVQAEHDILRTHTVKLLRLVERVHCDVLVDRSELIGSARRLLASIRGNMAADEAALMPLLRERLEEQARATF